MVALTSPLLPALLAFLVSAASVALAKALQSYSRSRLEEYCEDRGLPERADEVAHLEERTERGSELVAVISGLLAATMAILATDRSRSPVGTLLAILLLVIMGGLAYLLASVLGRVLAEPILFRVWPASHLIRGAAWPFSQIGVGLETLAEQWAVDAECGPRPSSVEVEIPAEEGDTSADADAELPESTRALLQRAVELTRTDVSEVMIPASSVISLPATVTARAASEAFRRTGRSRIPIFGANRDDIVGILIGKDLWERMIDAGNPDLVRPMSLVRPAFCVPESCNAFQLIGDLRVHRTQMAIVLDEYGAVAGIVTLEDLLEQLVGPIDDEHDVPAPSDPIAFIGGARYEVDAAVPIEVVNDRLDLHLPTEEDFETVGGLALHELGRLPDQGASFVHDGIRFTVLDVGDHQIRRMLIDLQPGGVVASG